MPAKQDPIAKITIHRRGLLNERAKVAFNSVKPLSLLLPQHQILYQHQRLNTNDPHHQSAL